MTTGWTIREEMARDIPAIDRVIEAAFTDHPFSDGSEPAIVARLREHGDLALSLVALAPGGRVVGHAAWSPVTLSTGDDGWLALGPVSVLPDLQKQGVGRTLVITGHARLRGRNAAGVVVVGDAAYYRRFGFGSDTPLTIAGELAPHFQVLPFAARVPRARVRFAEAFALAEGG